MAKGAMSKEARRSSREARAVSARSFRPLALFHIQFRLDPGSPFLLQFRIQHSAIIIATALLSGCGGGGSPAGPTGPPTNPYVITIAAGGVASPKDLQVPQGARVLFINNDSRRHDIASDEHPDHLECPVINQVGVLTTGQQRETGNFVVVRTCGFHDHDDPDNNNLKGRITTR
jgi:hypothetical protein